MINFPVIILFLLVIAHVVAIERAIETYASCSDQISGVEALTASRPALIVQKERLTKTIGLLFISLLLTAGAAVSTIEFSSLF